jgi:hypothetical protein
MAYTPNFSKSAHRHFQAAELLYTNVTVHENHKPVAGYLYGITGELAVKKLMQKSGIKELDEKERQSDPYYKHFPQLKALLKDAPGLRAGELRRIAENAALFQNWDTSMRYAPGGAVQNKWVDAWKESAKSLLDRMEAE